MITFNILEIKKYLLSKESLEAAIDDLSTEAIINLNSSIKVFNYPKTDENLKKYEIQIGLMKLKEQQIELRRKTQGKEGKEWLALSPRWITHKMENLPPTEYEIFYWANYADDETFGAFTVEQIIKWLTTPELRLHKLGGTKEKR